MSWHSTIRADTGDSGFAATAPLIELLSARPGLQQTRPVAFQAVTGQPWVMVVMAVRDPAGDLRLTG